MKFLCVTFLNEKVIEKNLYEIEGVYNEIIETIILE